MSSETRTEWKDFQQGIWQREINVRDFIQRNYTQYCDGEAFLSEATEKTKALNGKCKQLMTEERERGGVRSIDTDHVSSVLTYPAGYIDQENELIVGLQTDEPLKRGVNPFGGIRMAEQACNAYGYQLSNDVKEHFEFRTTHNDGVFRAYTEEMRTARHVGIITGLPDAYGRGRIIGDYRRVALYGVDYLIERKKEDKQMLGYRQMDEENIRRIEEVYREIDFLGKLKEMAALYGKDISKPSETALEATQAVYFAYLASIKEQNGAAMSLGRVSTFLDIYIERDMKRGVLDEKGAQEIIDQFVMKLRMARHLRTPEYNDLFAGDPMWITESLGGVGEDGRTLVTKNTYRFLHTLTNLDPSPEPNLTVLWSEKLPEPFKKYCAEMSIKTDSIQYENDDLMRDIYGDDYGIACCVSAMKIGKQMQFFGARCNLAKLLLMSLNGGRDEKTGIQVGPVTEAFSEDVLDYDKVMESYGNYMDWICKLYVNTMNIIHFMHDKYAYEKIQMALHDTDVERFMAFGIAGLSVVADSLSAIKYAKVKPVKNEKGIISDFEISGDFPKYGNNDDSVDNIAKMITELFLEKLKSNKTYRNAMHTLSVLTITSNVVYGKKTGSTPDGRKAGEPFAPGANPMHGRDEKGALASLASVAKLDYHTCRDGISCTFNVTPAALGKSEETRIFNLVAVLDGHFKNNAHHINVNVLNRETLIDAMEHPEKYPTLTIRVSGYAVRFISLNKDQQSEVIRRTFHEAM